MYDNWSEIIEIMKPILGFKRSRTEIKMALGSCLRTLGWRLTTGSMKNDFITKSGKTIDIILGIKELGDVFHPILPIMINTEETTKDIVDSVSAIMRDISVKICVVVGSSFDLFTIDQTSQKSINIGEIAFEQNNEEGIKLSSLLSVHGFEESNLVAYFDSLYKSRLQLIKLDEIINSIISDESKAEEVLRMYLELEGFEGEIVDKTLKNVGVNIFFKNKVGLDSQYNDQVSESLQLNKLGHDNTRFSLNGGDFVSKRQFVLNVVSQYIKENPYVTLEGLESRFPSELASKVRGVIRTWSQVKSWAEDNGPDILTRYCTKDNERILLSDGTEIVVNSQWGSKNFPRFLALAKSLYNDIRSDSPYEGIECVQNISNVNTNRAKNFKFSMAGIKIGETIIFDATQLKVKVVSDDTIEYNGSTYRLSTFVRTFIPDNMRTPSDTYRGPDFFSYKGETLTNLRYNHAKEQHHQTSENKKDVANNGIHISLHSYNSFKTNK